jgi:hypothetical protein
VSDQPKGADVSVTFDSGAALPDGLPDHVVRTVTKNSKTLKLQLAEFGDE